ncbi:MAG TPA: YchJ family metal-binding protein [Opitutaceae bacterium]|nr:YchJ family metal-binding protein [Opitutaceae bacterium]
MSQPVALPKPQPGSPCPCGSGKLFSECCEPLLRGTRTAATAEELMRSRFTAHVAQDFAYLHRTYLPTSKTKYVEEKSTNESPWTRLVVHSHDAQGDTAHVDFSAFFVDGDGPEQVLQEKAEFKRIKGEWIYTKAIRQGPAPVRSTAPKVGRNDPCPCGSGKKYKHCCLKA